MKIYSFPMLACALLMLCALPSMAFADSIMPNTHAIDKCVKITGLDAYPNYTFIGVVSPISSPNSPLEFVKIANNDCIVTGSHYKFDSFSIYYTTKAYYEKVGMNGIETGNISSNGRQGVVDENLVLISGDIASAPYAPYYVSDTDSAKSVTIKYGIRVQKGAFFMSKVSEEKSNQPLQKEAPVPGQQTPVACTADAKLCKDGSSVGRNGSLNCAFNPCPDEQDLPPAPPGEPRTPTPQNPAPTPLNQYEAFWSWFMNSFGGLFGFNVQQPASQ